MSLDSLVNLTITTKSKAPSQAGFGLPMILAFHEAWTDRRTKLYAEAAELLDDGFTTADAVYQMAIAIKSQKPAPEKFLVGRREFVYTTTLDPTTNISTGNVLAVTLDGVLVTHTVLLAQNGNKQLVVEALALAATTALGASGYVITENNDKVTVKGPDGAPIVVTSPTLITTASVVVDPPLQTIRLTPNKLGSGKTYAGSVGGTAFTYSVASGDAGDLDDICTAFAAKLNTDLAALDITITAAATYVQLRTDDAGVIFEYVLPENLKVKDVTDDNTLASDLAACRAENDDWYCLYTDLNGADTILAAAAAIEATRKIYVCQSADWDIKDSGQTGDIASQLKTATYARTFGIFHDRIGGSLGWCAAGWSASRLTSAPGSDSWAHKSISGVTTVKLQPSEETAINNKNWSTYTEVAGNGNTFEGKSGAGEYADIVRGIDWLYARIQENVIFTLQNNPRIPFTRKGVALMTGAIEQVLIVAVNKPYELLSDDPDDKPIVTAPEPSAVSAADRIGRVLPDINFSGRLSGGIHRLKIAGTLSV